MLQGTYLSSDELERSDALEYGYHTVCQHPREVCKLIAGQRLVIDLNHVLFDDQDEAVQLACAAAEQGLWVGIHTYYTEHPRLLPLLGRPNVVIEKTHGQVCQALRLASGHQAGHGSAGSLAGVPAIGGVGREAPASGASTS
jgi:hypothetical protein